MFADEIVAPAKESTAAKYNGTLRRVTAVVEMQGQMKTMVHGARVRHLKGNAARSTTCWNK